MKLSMMRKIITAASLGLKIRGNRDDQQTVDMLDNMLVEIEEILKHVLEEARLLTRYSAFTQEKAQRLRTTEALLTTHAFNAQRKAETLSAKIKDVLDEDFDNPNDGRNSRQT